MAVDSDVDCERVDVVSKTTFYNVTELRRLTCRHGCYGGWEGRIERPPRVTESKGRHNEYLKKNALKLLTQMKGNSTNNCEFERS